MKTRMVSGAAIAALAGLLCFGAVTAAGVKHVESNVKITEGGPDGFEGKVTSDKRKCIKHRKVTLKYSSGARKGEPAWTTRTDDNGRWDIAGAFNAGLYQAVVQRAAFESYVCLATKTIKMQF